jgi:glycosyltransferase involved in cell wall biosynthesis
MSTVSVVVPNYNHARYLQRRVESILEQTYQDFELILLDDCSTDESRAILTVYASHPRVRTEFNERNSGTPFKQWNKGVRMARGDYVWIAESDDYADPDFLNRMVRILDEQPEVTFAYCRSWSIGERDQRFGFADTYLNCLDADHWKANFVVDGFEECRRFFVLAAPVPNASSVLFRKDIYERVGRADEELCLCGDYKVFAAMAGEGKIAYLAEPLNYYRSHGETARARTGQGVLSISEYFYVMLSVIDRVNIRETPARKTGTHDLLSRPPSKLDSRERVEVARKSLSYITDWNLRHNRYIPENILRKYFINWEFALYENEFATFPPSRWRFFVHRCRFYRHYFVGMGWKLRAINLMRVLGAPFVGYRHRHWPEQAYAWIARRLSGTFSGNRRANT